MVFAGEKRWRRVQTNPLRFPLAFPSVSGDSFLTGDHFLEHFVTALSLAADGSASNRRGVLRVGDGGFEWRHRIGDNDLDVQTASGPSSSSSQSVGTPSDSAESTGAWIAFRRRPFPCEVGPF